MKTTARAAPSACGWFSPEAQRSFLYAAAYAGMSFTLSLLNKTLLSVFDFECPFLLLGIQLALSLLFCAVTRDYLGNPLGVEPLDRSTLTAAIPMGVSYAANVSLGLVGLKLVNVPMFFCIRRLVPACIMVVEYFLLGKTADLSTVGSVGLIAAGTVLAGWQSLGSEFLGYTVTGLNNLATAAAFISQKAFATSINRKLSTFSVMQYNAIIALPLCAIGAIVTGEIEVRGDAADGAATLCSKGTRRSLSSRYPSR
jgi:hypothetical protein